MKESYNTGVRPIRASGTRRTSHKTGVMMRIFDKFGLHITHLENVATDTSYKIQKQPPRVVPRKKCSENMQQFTEEHPCRTAIVEMALRQGCFSCKFAIYFQNTFS